MIPVCPAPGPATPLVAGLNLSVDCGVRRFAQFGYEALTRPPSPLPAIITALLTLYVALLGWGLLTGRGPRLAEAPQLAFRMGAVLALTASWPLFQTLVFATAFDGPASLARLVGGPGEGLWLGLQNAYDQIVVIAASLGAQAGPDTNGLSGGPAAAAQALWGASAILLASTLGVTLAAKIVVGVLTAVGPIFVALFLLDITRGAFLGWMRALATAALIPLCASLGLALLLGLLQPRLSLLATAEAQGVVDLSTAMGAAALIYVVAAAQACLVAAMAFAGLGLRLKAQPALETARPSAVGLAPSTPPRQQDRAAAVAQTVRRLDRRESFNLSTAERRIDGGAARERGGQGESAAPRRLSDAGRRIRRPVVRHGGSA